jgi:Na+-driven multidrug efflux pump
MRIILFGAVFSTVTPGMNNFIRSMGHPKTAMFRTLIGAVCNVFFDWLFIMKLGWGIAGAAWATVLSQFIASTFVMSFFLQKETPIKISPRYMRLKMPYVRRIFIMGLPPSVMQLCNSLMNVILNKSLFFYGNQSTYGGDMAISAFGIVNGIALIMLMPVMGFVQGVQPIIGYNYGARSFDRVRKTLKYALGYSVTFMCSAWCLIQFQSEWLVGFFARDNVLLTTLASESIRMFLLALPMIGIGMICGNFFQGTGKPGRALILNMCRQVLILIPLLLIIPRFVGLKGVFMAAPIADTAAAALSIILLTLELRHMRAVEAR